MEVDTYFAIPGFTKAGKIRPAVGQLHVDVVVSLWSEGSTKQDPEQYQKIGELAGISSSWTVLSTRAGQTAINTMTIHRKCVRERG